MSKITHSISIDVDRVHGHLDSLWDIGRTSGGGVTRLAYSDKETEAFEYIMNSLSKEFDTYVDQIGNLFAATDIESDRLIFVGSHLDSVYNGGRLDGALGVATAVEAIQSIQETDISLAAEPMLCVFRAEESARFGQHTIGSKGALGQLSVDDLTATDEEGVPLWQAMQRSGYQPDELATPVFDPDRIDGFLEVHIEQGRVLDEKELDVGVVTSIRGPVRYRFTVTGKFDHSGATPMDLREDALAAASRMILAVENIGVELAKEDDIVTTVGDITARNGAINIICGDVTFPTDLRSTNESFRDRAESRMLKEFREIASQREIELSEEELSRSSPVSLDDGITELLKGVADDIGASSIKLPSGGGHDAMNFQMEGIPTGMIFVPSVDGVSHNPNEETPPESIEYATEMIAHAVVRLSE